MKYTEEARVVNVGAEKKFMWEIVKIAGIFIFLFFCSIQDIREKQLSVKMLVLSGVLFFALSLFFDRISFAERMGNMLPGMAAFVIAFFTKEQVGYGDAACLIVLGNVLSVDILMGAVMGGLLSLSLCGAVLFLRKKADRKTTLPFAPFLMAGVLWQVIIQKGGTL